MMQTKKGEWIIRLDSVRKSYGELIAVKDLSLDIRRGEIFGFLGPNGAGKTTTISMICGLLKKDGGEININGHSLDADYTICKKWMGLCPQDIVIWESLTCLEQMEFTARLYDVPRTIARNRSLELLSLFGLEEKILHVGYNVPRLGIDGNLVTAPACEKSCDRIVGIEPRAFLVEHRCLQIRAETYMS